MQEGKTQSSTVLDKINRWLDSVQTSAKTAEAATFIKSLKENLEPSKLEVAQLTRGSELAILPLKIDFKANVNSSTNATNAIVVLFTKEGKVNKVGIVDYDKPGHLRSALPVSSVVNLFGSSSGMVDGKYGLSTIFGQPEFEVVVERGCWSKYSARQQRSSGSENVGGRQQGCIDWYWVTTYSDGSQTWQYIYTTCNDGPETNTCKTLSVDGREFKVNCTSNGGGGADMLDPVEPEFYFFFNGPAINLEELFNCFDQVPEAGATYKIKLCADLPVNSSSEPLVNAGAGVGHAFITLTKSNGGVSVSQSFGFYPNTGGIKTVFGSPQDSKMVNDANHEVNASIEISIDRDAFVLAKNSAIVNANSHQYDLDDYNCTDYALGIYNVVSGSNNQVWVPDRIGGAIGRNYGTTPNELWNRLKLRENSPNVFIGTTNSPSGGGLCP